MKTLCFTLLCKSLSHHFFFFVVCIHGANFNSLPLGVTLQVVLLYWSSNHINLSLRVLWRLSDVIFIVHCAFFWRSFKSFSTHSQSRSYTRPIKSSISHQMLKTTPRARKSSLFFSWLTFRIWRSRAAWSLHQVARPTRLALTDSS